MNLDFNFTANDVINQKRTTKENIDAIKNWLFIDTEKCIPGKIQDELIVLFLLSCDNDIELTKKTVKAYYKYRKECPDIFDDRRMERKCLQKAFNTMRMVTIPIRTDDNDVIIYFSLRDTSHSNFELLPIMKGSFMLIDAQQHGNPPDSLTYLIDMKGFSPMHITKLRPDPLNKYFSYLGEGLPIKLKAMHFLNSNYFLEKLLLLIGPFLNPNVKKRLHMHPPGMPMEELIKFIPKKCLPKELEGDLESEEELCKKTMESLKNKEKFWEIEEKLRKNVKN